MPCIIFLMACVELFGQNNVPQIGKKNKLTLSNNSDETNEYPLIERNNMYIQKQYF